MKKILLFDFDGVIVDSFELSFTNHQKQKPDATPDGYRGYFRGNV